MFGNKEALFVVVRKGKERFSTNTIETPEEWIWERISVWGNHLSARKRIWYPLSKKRLEQKEIPWVIRDRE